MEDGTIEVVRGKQVVPTAGAALREIAARHARVVIDVGAGDGRAMYRLGRVHTDWFCIAMDAAAEGLREVSRRAGRTLSRGGAPNVWCVRARAEAPPEPLRGLADLVMVDFPWGRLLRGLMTPDPVMVRAVASLGRPGAAFHIRVNASALQNGAAAGLWPGVSGQEEWQSRIASAYAAAGVSLSGVEWQQRPAATSWARRLGGRAPLALLVLEGTVTGIPRGTAARLPARATTGAPGRNSDTGAVNKGDLTHT